VSPPVSGRRHSLAKPLQCSGEAFRLFNGFRILAGRCAQFSEFLRMFTVGER